MGIKKSLLIFILSLLLVACSKNSIELDGAEKEESTNHQEELDVSIEDVEIKEPKNEQKKEDEIMESNLEDVDQKVYYGKWIITADVSPNGMITTFGNDDVEEVLDIEFEIYDKTIIYDGERTSDLIFVENYFTEKELWNATLATFLDLGLDPPDSKVESIFVYETEDAYNTWNSIVSEFYVKDSDTLLLYYMGNVFEAKRIE